MVTFPTRAKARRRRPGGWNGRIGATEQPDPGIVLSARRVLPALGVGILAGAGVALAGEALLAPVTAWAVAAVARAL